MNTPHLLLVDDEPHVLSALTRALRRGTTDGLWPALHIDTFTDPEAALAHAERHPVDLVISDFRMPGMNGARFLSQLRQHHPEARRIMLSGYTDFDGLADAVNSARISLFLPKPWNEAELLAAVHELLEERRQSHGTDKPVDPQPLSTGGHPPRQGEGRWS